MREHPPNLGDLPVTILSAANGELSPAHRASATSLTNGRYAEIAASGHNIMFDQPAAVVSEIARMFARLD